MRQLRPGLWMMESSSPLGCNTFLIADAGRVFLVDPGPSFQLNPVARELRAAGRTAYEVTDVLLTHYDWDHARSAAEWQRRTGAKVWLGAGDVEVLRSRRVPGRTVRRLLVWAYRLPKLPESVVELRGEITIVPGLTALPTPGHTPGHYAFLWRDAALVGDAAMTGRDGELVRLTGQLMTDPAQSEATRRLLSALPARVFCPGHGPVVERRGSR